MRQTLKQSKFLGGNKLNYADIAVAGNFLVNFENDMPIDGPAVGCVNVRCCWCAFPEELAWTCARLHFRKTKLAVLVARTRFHWQPGFMLCHRGLDQ